MSRSTLWHFTVCRDGVIHHDAAASQSDAEQVATEALLRCPDAAVYIRNPSGGRTYQFKPRPARFLLRRVLD